MTSFSQLLSDVFDRGAEAPIADSAEERMTIASAQLGDDAATLALVLAYAPTLRKAVKPFTAATGAMAQDADVEDVRMQAALGLVEAIQAFDAERHTRLAAIAKEYVADRVSQAAGVTAQFNVPSRTLTRFFAIMRAASGNVYEAAALAPEYKMKRETFFAVLSAVREVDSYDAPAGGESDDPLLVSMDATAVYGRVKSDSDLVEDVILVEAAFGAVDDLEEDVVRLAYGFSDYDPVPDAEIAERIGLSRQKAQRTRTGALGKMRDALGVA